MNDKFQKFKILVRLNWLLPQLNSDGLFLFNFVVWFFLFNFETS